MNTNFSLNIPKQALRQVLKLMLQIKANKSDEGCNLAELSFSGDMLRIAVIGSNSLRLRMTKTLEGTSELSSSVDTIINVAQSRLINVLKVCTSKTLNLSGNEAQLTITEENGAFYRLKCSDIMFPEPMEMDDVVAEFTLPESSSAYISSVACFAALKDAFRPAMEGLLLESDGENICAVTTDGYRLVKLTMPVRIKKPLSVIIPVAAVRLAASKSDVRVLVSTTRVQFFLDEGKTEIAVQTILERFPPYQTVIPALQPYNATVNLLALLAALKRVSVCANKQTKAMFYTFANDAITLTTTSDEAGAEDDDSAEARHVVSAQYTAQEMTIKMNYRYFQDALEHLRKMGVSDIEIGFSEGHKPVTVRSTSVGEGACEAMMLVMPMRL
jgi:DNA polymerase-3 subunit beta